MPKLPKMPRIKGMDKVTALFARLSDSARLRGTFRVLAWSLGIFFVMVSVAWVSLPTGAIAWRVSHEARKAGTDVTISGGNGYFAGVGMNQLMNHLRPRLAKRLAFIEPEQPIEKIVEQLNAIERIGSVLTYPSVLTILVREK